MAEEKKTEKVKLKKVKNLDGVKLVYRWGVGTWLTLLFGLLAIAVVAGGALLLPYYTTSATFPTTLMGPGTGVNLFMDAFKSFSTDLAGLKDTAFGGLWQLLIDAFWNGEGEANAFVQFLQTSGKYLILVFLVFFAVSCVFAIVAFIMWFILLVSGRLKHYKGPFVCAIWMFVFNFLYAVMGIVLMIMLLVKRSGASISVGGTEILVAPMDLFKLFIYPFAMAIASLLLLIIIGIIYKSCFFDHKFIKNAQELEDYKKRMVNRKLAKGNVDGPAAAPTVAAPGTPVNVVININGYKADASTNDKGEIEVNPEKKPGEQPKEEKPSEEAKKPETVQPITVEEKPVESEELIKPSNQLTGDVKFIGGHAFSKNVDLQVADIPSGVPSLGVGAFSNCVNLKALSIPSSVKEIGANCFFNCKRLKRIDFEGTKKEFKQIKRGSNWLAHAGTTIVYCVDGPLAVNPLL